jgi:hypothetical protein
MSEVHESKPFQRFPRTISEMGPWDFQASTDSLGLTIEEEAACLSGVATADQMVRLEISCHHARVALLNAEAGNPMSRPS